MKGQKETQRIVGKARSSIEVNGRRGSAYWADWGYRAGKQDAASYSIDKDPFQKKALNALWMNQIESGGVRDLSWRHYSSAAHAYVQGFCKAKKTRVHDWVMMP